jgi:hypothetical protein
MSHFDHKMGKGRRRTRTAVVLAFVTAALCFGGSMSSIASAQSSGAPTLDSQRPDVGPKPAPVGPMQAPVGHRQPRQQDLPPSVLRDEGGPGVSRDDRGTTTGQGATGQGATGQGATGQGASDRSLTICRNC